jgi:hypothetical protein
MWPKVLMQLFDLLPHVSRLVPVAERYFAGRAQTEHNNENTLAAMAESVDGTMGQLAKAHEGLYRRLQEQDNQIAVLSEEVRQLRSMSEAESRRIHLMTDEVGTIGVWLKVVAGLTAILLALVVVLLMRGH